MPIFISGTLDEVKIKLTAMYDIIQDKKRDGWRLFQPDEEYDFSTVGDNNVCPICQGLVGTFNGVDVPIIFGAWQRRGQNIIYHNTHESLRSEVPYLRGDCRCTLIWEDYPSILIERLFAEMAVKA